MLRPLFISAMITLCTINPLYGTEVYQEMPRNFSPKIEVAGCFIRSGEQVLFLKRLSCKPQGNTWGIPGGKADKGETAEETVIREIREETGIEIEQQSLIYFGKVYLTHTTGNIVLHIFEYNIKAPEQIKFNPKEHADYRWTTLEEALEMTLIPGEPELIQMAYGTQPLPQISYHFTNQTE
jgi:mutator protein MutT